MDIGKAIFARLTTEAATAAIVGTNVYPEASTEDKFPFVVYTAANNTPKAVGYKVKTQRFTITITVVSDTYSQAQALADAVRNAMDKLSGSFGGINIVGCSFNEDSSEEIAESGNSERIFYLGELSFTLFAL